MGNFGPFHHREHPWDVPDQRFFEEPDDLVSFASLRLFMNSPRREGLIDSQNTRDGSRSPAWALECVEADVEASLRVLIPYLGNMPNEFDQVLSMGLETFTLAEGCQVDSHPLIGLWGHSLRTGVLAALIVKSFVGQSPMAWEAFVGGVIHDLGHVVFLTQHPDLFERVVDITRKKGEGISCVEKHLLGTSHGEAGAFLLKRWGIGDSFREIVEFHDEPFLLPDWCFSPLTAVYVANLLDGGGIPHDGDGTIGEAGEQYLRKLDLWNRLPVWQNWIRSIVLECA